MGCFFALCHLPDAIRAPRITRAPHREKRVVGRFWRKKRVPSLNLALNELPFTERGALSHLGLQVASTEDALALLARWVEAGLATRDEMQTSCCYAVQDKTWVSDPDGNEWEVFVVLEDNLPEASGAGFSACCNTEPASLVNLTR